MRGCRVRHCTRRLLSAPPSAEWMLTPGERHAPSRPAAASLLAGISAITPATEYHTQAPYLFRTDAISIHAASSLDLLSSRASTPFFPLKKNLIAYATEGTFCRCWPPHPLSIDLLIPSSSAVLLFFPTKQKTSQMCYIFTLSIARYFPLPLLHTLVVDSDTSLLHTFPPLSHCSSARRVRVGVLPARCLFPSAALFFIVLREPDANGHDWDLEEGAASGGRIYSDWGLLCMCFLCWSSLLPSRL